MAIGICPPISLIRPLVDLKQQVTHLHFGSEFDARVERDLRQISADASTNLDRFDRLQSPREVLKVSDLLLGRRGDLDMVDLRS